MKTVRHRLTCSADCTAAIAIEISGQHDVSSVSQLLDAAGRLGRLAARQPASLLRSPHAGRQAGVLLLPSTARHHARRGMRVGDAAVRRLEDAVLWELYGNTAVAAALGPAATLVRQLVDEILALRKERQAQTELRKESP